MELYKVNFCLLAFVALFHLSTALSVPQQGGRPLRAAVETPVASLEGIQAVDVAEGPEGDGGAKRTVKRGALYGGYGGFYGAGYGYGSYGLYGGYGGYGGYGYGGYPYHYGGYGYPYYSYGYGHYPFGYSYGWY